MKETKRAAIQLAGDHMRELGAVDVAELAPKHRDRRGLCSCATCTDPKAAVRATLRQEKARRLLDMGEECCWCDRRAEHVADNGGTLEPACREHWAEFCANDRDVAARL